MSDIAKLIGNKRAWVGEQQAIDLDDDEYEDFKTDGTLAGNNTLSNVVWKQAKIIESGGEDWIGNSRPGNIDLAIYNDAIAFPNLFDFANNTDNTTLSQLAYKTALIHADFKANEYDTLEVSVNNNTSNVATNTTNITTLQNNFKDMDLRNISTHRIELDANNTYEIPDLIKIVYSNDSYAFTNKDGNSFPGTQGKLKITVLDWPNFYKWVSLVDHVGIFVETDLTSGATGIGVSDINLINGNPDYTQWEYFPNTSLGTLNRSYIIHFQVPNSTQVNVFFYLPRSKVNDYNITYDKSEDYDAFYSSDLNQSIQFTNGTSTNTKFTLIAYNDTIDRFDVIYQPLKTISHHPLNSNADTIALAEKIETNTSNITKLEKWVIDYHNYATDFSGWAAGTLNVGIGRDINWVLTNGLTNVKISLNNDGTVNVTTVQPNVSGYYTSIFGALNVLHVSNSITGGSDSSHHNFNSTETGVQTLSHTTNTLQISKLNATLKQWNLWLLRARGWFELDLNICYDNININSTNFSVHDTNKGNMVVKVYVCYGYIIGFGTNSSTNTQCFFSIHAGPMKHTHNNTTTIITPTITTI